ncbi:DUF5684 domain-containing protein [Microbacterium enclense]|uniref:FHA domain-containing protein n=1 Tax=Microbacterium enclense TaxID=993073 RepID=A0A1G6GS98_9MICO|nr:DUF5684 domain-containing protein [Microbacterium enclense]KSU55852.1 hypothetical protein AS029_01735 [Microbacterium enclense]SDB84585.1 FHA domain-containing protein [Microbacterium enclense]
MTDSTMVVLGMTSLALVVVLYVWFALALAAMFEKMGEPTWKAWVPIVNVATVLQRGDFSPWLVLLNVVPLFGAVAFVIVFIVAVRRITVGFGGGVGLTVVGALVPVVWASILGWGSARWTGEGGAGLVDERSGPFRRGDDHAPAYVPLVGGWTPQVAGATDAPGSDRGGWAPAGGAATREPGSEHARWIPDAPAPEREGPGSALPSEPVVLPFAAPSTPLADAVPSSIDWSAPADRGPVSFEEQRPIGGSARHGRTGTDADESMSDVLDALRDERPRGAGGLRRGLGVDALQGLSATRADEENAPTDGPRVVLDASISGGAPRAGEPSAPSSSERPDDSVDAVADPEPPDAPWSTPSRRAQRSASEPAAPIADVPLTRPSPETAAIARPSVVAPGEEFPELSEAVSAVSEVPEAGSPRPARTSVSSLYAQSAVPDVSDDDADALDRTVVTRRKRIPWMLVPPGGAPVALTSDVVILGRRPVPDAAHPDAQLVAISDETRTVSKTHARLQLRGDTWFVTDLDSTNGVLFATLMGTEVEAPRGEEIEAGARFFLGDAEVRLARSDA